jgi:hypothetical protein
MNLEKLPWRRKTTAVEKQDCWLDQDPKTVSKWHHGDCPWCKTAFSIEDGVCMECHRVKRTGEIVKRVAKKDVRT